MVNKDMKDMKILIIDDDIDLCTLLSEFFSTEGKIQTKIMHNPVDGVEELRNNDYDLLILDLMLPVFDGFEACKKIREFSDIPVIMLTAKNSLEDKVTGLELGADDYVSKPFEPKELLARCNSLVRRSSMYAQGNLNLDNLVFDDLLIDFSKFQVKYKDKNIHLTSMEFDALALLAKNQEKVFSRKDLLLELKGVDTDIYTRSIDVLMSRLRHKLNQICDKEYLMTVWGKGYKFTP